MDFATAYHWPRMPVVRRSSIPYLSTLSMGAAPADLLGAIALRTLDLGDRMVRRISRRHRLGIADDHAHQRLLDALIDEAAVDAGRHREQVALLEHGLEALALVLDDESRLVAP